MRVQRAPAWRERCCRYRPDADVIDRAGCSCPHAAPGYRPPCAATRPEQEVALPGGGWWRGRTCPVAVTQADPLVGALNRSYTPLVAFGGFPWAGGWGEQPAWWTEAVQVVHRAMDDVDREETAE